MWGIIPAAGRGSRIQPLAFSKELLPVGSRRDGPRERPCAVSEYLVERMIAGGADKLCFVIAPGKSDIMEYYGRGYEGAHAAYVVQPDAAGLCDAIFQARHLVGPDEQILVGLPDTVWFPLDGFAHLPDDRLSFLLFPVENPEAFDAVLLDHEARVLAIDVKSPSPRSHWIWGAFKMPGRLFHELHALWEERQRADEFFGTLVNAWIDKGGVATGVTAGETYVDVGTFPGYRIAVGLLSEGAPAAALNSTRAALD